MTRSFKDWVYVLLVCGFAMQWIMFGITTLAEMGSYASVSDLAKNIFAVLVCTWVFAPFTLNWWIDKRVAQIIKEGKVKV